MAVSEHARALLLLALCAPLGAQMTWSRIDMPPRSGSALTFDPMRQRIVMFGGFDGWSHLGDTLEWDGRRWLRIADRGPAPRRGTAMAYDPTTRCVVLFGGTDSPAPGQGTYWRDTWEWDGISGTWSVVSQVGPPVRDGHAMVWDPTRQRVLLHGGSDAQGRALGDTWEWDGARRSWTQVSQTGPQPMRRGFAMAFDGLAGRAVLFGGFAAGYLADTWQWDGSTGRWTLSATAGPSARAGHAMIYDPMSHRVLLIGGGETQAIPPRLVGDLWAWDGTTNTWTRVADAGLTPRAGHVAAYDPTRRRSCVFGGFVGYASEWLGDTWEWDGSRWLLGAPSPRQELAAAWDVGRHRLVLFGGADVYLGAQADTWEWDGEVWELRVAGSAPPPRRNHAMAYDAGRGVSVLLGGSDAAGVVGPEAWEWDGIQWTRFVRSAAPGPREGHAMAYDAARRRTVVFGGYDGSTCLGETWLWDGAAWTFVAGSGPPRRTAHAMSYDASRERVVMFGGACGRTHFGDTWEWDGSAWSQAASSGPSWRWNHAMAYDAERERVVMFGGADGVGSPNDTWEWDGSSWTQILASAPNVRTGHALAYDRLHGRVVSIGGLQPVPEQLKGDMWSYEPTVRGGAASVGFGCRGSAGTPTLTALGPPVVGNGRFRLAITAVPANASVFVGLSSQLRGTSLAPCWVYPALPFHAVCSGTANAVGIAELSLPIPWLAPLGGASLFVQGGALDPGGVLLGAMSLTPGMHIRVGD
ncbi:MAG: hypothetical protein IPM29_03180 [Planctomycetes bacterium]|nr:hypothetical protein [Planctomycetota bacterium]